MDELLTDRIMEWKLTYGDTPVSLADLLCDRFAGSDRVAVIAENAAGGVQSLTYPDLQDRSARFAGVLRGLGVDKGDRVATLLPKSPELVITLLAVWRLGAVCVPLSTTLGTHAVAHRLEQNNAAAIVTDGDNRSTIGALRNIAPRVVVIEQSEHGVQPGDIGYWDSLGTVEPVSGSAFYAGRDPMVVIYTSGTTGHPKGIPVPAKSLAAVRAYLHFGLDVQGDDVYWNTADPAWAHGLLYALIGPLLLGQSTVFVDGPFDAERTERVWRTYGVTNFSAAPSAFRALCAAGVPHGGRDGLDVRIATSTGDPLAPDLIDWARENLGIPLHDHYGQSEHGMLIDNHHHPDLQRPVRPGAIGHPMPGFEITLLESTGAEAGPGESGRIALDIARSSLFWFTGYLDDPQATARAVSPDGRYFLTGDTGSRDSDGYIMFIGRSDDLIDNGGHFAGPLETERVLAGHPAVAEAAVIGIPETTRGETVIAYVVARPGVDVTPQLGIELIQFVEDRPGSHVHPREVRFIDALPKTPSGNLQRYKVRALASERNRSHG
jgi:acetyl-CoA synthetase